jgi:hypothetical protein
MPRWVLSCPECHEEFTHSDVPVSVVNRLDVASPPKPDFPDDGERLQCIKCGNISFYQRFQLTLQMLNR